jgi:hypothetical protein
MEAKLYELFGWRSGSFRFKEGEEPPGQPVGLEKTPAALVLEGIRRHYDRARADAVLAGFAGNYVAPSGDPLRRLQGISDDPAERRFIESLDGSKKLETVLSSAPIAAAEARLLLVAMAESGMIEPARSAARRAGAEGRRTTPGYTTPPPELRPQAERSPRGGAGGSAAGAPSRGVWDPVRVPDTSDELNTLLETMKAGSYFENLGVDEEATASEVDQAYEARAREFHPDRFRLRPEDVRQVGLKIFDRLGDAQATLRDSSRRRRYVAKLERDRAEKVLDTLSPMPPPAAEKVYYGGVEALRARRYHEAVESFRRAIELAPGQASYHGALGWALFREAPGDPAAVEAGLRELRRALDMNGNDPWVRISLGRFYAETGWVDQAIEEFETALMLNPGLTDVQEEIRRLRGET